MQKIPCKSSSVKGHLHHGTKGNFFLSGLGIYASDILQKKSGQVKKKNFSIMGSAVVTGPCASGSVWF